MHVVYKKYITDKTCKKIKNKERMTLLQLNIKNLI